jgi:hypothetical protein
LGRHFTSFFWTQRYSVLLFFERRNIEQTNKNIKMNKTNNTVLFSILFVFVFVHLYNFENLRNRTETPLLMQAVLNGAEQAGYMDGIIFLNYE